MSGFYLNLDLKKIEDQAHQQGFSGPSWKKELMDDLVVDGRLQISKGSDPRDPSKVVWYCRGRRASLACVPDERFLDALFCIGVVAGPQRGGPPVRGRVVVVPGPWALHTFHRRSPPAVTAEEHLQKLFSASAVPQPSAAAPAAPAPRGTLGALLAKATGARESGSIAKGGAASPVPGARTAPGQRPVPPKPVERDPSVSDDVSTQVPPIDAKTTSTEPAHAPGLQDSVNEAMQPGARTDESTAPGPTADESAEVRSWDDDAGLAPTHADAKVTVAQASDDDPASEPDESPEARGAPSGHDVEEEERGAKGVEGSRTYNGHASWSSLAIAVSLDGREELEGLLDASDPIDARRQRIRRLEAELALIQRQLASVPEESVILDRVEVRRQVDELGARLSGGPPRSIVVPSPAHLLDVLTTLLDPISAHLPSWAVTAGLDTDEGRAEVLGDPALQDQLQQAVAWVQRRFAGAPPSSLAALQDRRSRGTVAERLEDAWQAEDSLRSVLAELPQSCEGPLRALPQQALQMVAERLKSWASALHEDAFAGLLQILAERASSDTVPDPSILAPLAEEDRESLRDLRKWSGAWKYIQRCQPPSQPTSPPVSGVHPQPRVQADRPAVLLEFSHVVTDERGHVMAPTLVVPKPAAGSVHVVVEVPVRIVADRPLQEPLQVQIASALLKGLPADVPLGGGVQVRPTGDSRALVWRVDVGPDRWVPLDAGRVVREEILPIPLPLSGASRLRDQKESLTLRLSAASVANNLSFQSIGSALLVSPDGSGLGQASDTEIVQSRPLGAQVQHEKLEGLVREGRHSFMVVAPRRFGKTTLFMHLAAYAAELADHEVVRVSLERDLSPEQGVRSVWEALRTALNGRYRAAPDLGASSPASLMDLRAWESVRRFLREKGRATLVLLIDEAQVLVPRAEGVRWGNQFKNFVEAHLCVPGPEGALVQIGLFGTVDLAVRMGANCRDFLLMHGYQSYAFDELSLQRFLRESGKGVLASSRAARQALARWSNNLRTLLWLFDRLRQRLVQRQRRFMLDVDVSSCIQDLFESGGHAEEIWSYARAELSHRDEWDPIDALPMAVAWARFETVHPMQQERLSACVAWLTEELRSLDTSGEIPKERGEEALRELKARGVLQDNGEFYRPLLRELLRRRDRVLREDKGSQLALLRLAVDTVTWPETAEERAEGGQARVFVASRGDRAIAYRACALDGDEARRRFARTCAAIRSLRDRRTRQRGDERLPRVIEAGFRSDDPSQGVIVYDWVEGESFEHLWPVLPVQGRAYVVRQVAEALLALHSRDVLHCDVAPRNVIVNSRLDATLIDFGLARRADAPTLTRLAPDPFKAPEQCEPLPTAGKASDVYALGVLLRGPDGNPQLPAEWGTLVGQMMALTPEARPTVMQVVQELERLIDFEPAIHRLTSEVEDIVADAPDWLWEDMLSAKSAAAMARGGMLVWDEHRAMEVAFLLNKLFVRVVGQHQGTVASRLADVCTDRELSLAVVHEYVDRDPDASVKAWASESVRAVGLLRNAWAHPGDRKRKLMEVRRRLKASEEDLPTKMADATRQVAALLDQMLKSPDRPVSRYVEVFVESA